MRNLSFVLQVETPSVKKYVFGTDSLNQVRGASAWLDWLNRAEMGRVLRERIGRSHVETIYANGGSAQFLVQKCDESTVETACRDLRRHIRDQTGGEVQVVCGIAPLQDDASYHEAARLAHFRLRCQREFAGSHHSASTMPTLMECRSASHLPAAHRVDRDAEGAEMLSEASHRKAQEGQGARTGALWSGWMKHLQESGPWPAEERWKDLRCPGMTDIGDGSSWRNYVGLVYADGNAMGRLVQALDRLETCRHFSEIVDSSIREACFSGLQAVIGTEVERVRRALEQNGPFAALPADILLLGGDDLLVAVPATSALEFARHITDEFERLTREKISALQDENARRFFQHRHGAKHFTVSCGVAIAKSTYPFYLLLDLAEQLLRNAKRSLRPAAQGATDDARDAARIDFHVVAGASSHVLEQVRADTYRAGTSAPRTLRPLSCVQLESLRAAVQELRRVDFPRSKLHELEDAALTPEQHHAERRIRDIFARSRHGSERSQRRALWNAAKHLCPEGHTFDFPWFRRGSQRLSCVADLVDAYELFGHHEGPAS